MIICPKQPYFVMTTNKYYKAVVLDYGISHFYGFVKNDLATKALVAVPDGCIDLLFCCDPARPFADVCGSVLHATIVEKKDNAYYFGVRFLPGNGFKYRNVKMEEIIDHEIPLLEILDEKEMFDKIVQTTDFQEQTRIFMEYYLKYYGNAIMEKDHNHLKNYLFRRVYETAGQIKVKDLAKETGYSVRYINQTFVESFGIAPKVFCKIIRFQNLLSNLGDADEQAMDASLSALAMDMGYYDQSHMIKDFVELSDTTPGKYMHFLQESKYKKRIVMV